MAGSDDERAETAGPGDDVLQALRTWGVVFTDFGRQFGLHAGMHVTDAEALIQITSAESNGAPLTPAQLSRHIGLSSGATSALLNRLETAGHIERHRDRSDRRAVTLRSTEAVHRRVDEFFAAVGGELETRLAARPPEFLADVARLVSELSGVMERHLAPLVQQRGQAPAPR